MITLLRKIDNRYLNKQGYLSKYFFRPSFFTNHEGIKKNRKNVFLKPPYVAYRIRNY